MIQYPSDYFEDEYRDGFLVERTMKCAWAAQIEVLRHIADVCEKHSLKYFAFFGTLLGAVRHQGFIPWDDDIDIVMLRSDYQKFLMVCKEELPKDYCILNCYDYAEWGEINIRITNGDYIDLSDKRMSEYYGCPFSVGVDVYPLDTIPDDQQVLQQEKDILGIIGHAFQKLNELEKEKDSEKLKKLEEEVANDLQRISQILEFTFDFQINIKSQLLQLFDQMCQVFSEEEGKMVTTMPNYIKGSSKIFNKLWLRESIDWPFEYGTIKIPIGFEACLWVRFGVNYMIPKQQNSSHEYPFYKLQKKLLEEKGLWSDLDLKSKEIIRYIYGSNSSFEDNNEISNRESTHKITVFYRVSIVDFLQNKEKSLVKINHSLEMFMRESEKVDLIFVPDEEIIETYDNSTVVSQYTRLLKKIEKMGKVVTVDWGEVQSKLLLADAFYGDNNSWVYFFKKMNKPMMIQNINV